MAMAFLVTAGRCKYLYKKARTHALLVSLVLAHDMSRSKRYMCMNDPVSSKAHVPIPFNFS